MKYKIEESGKPAYLQLYEQLRADIVNGAYPYQSKIPSKRIMSEELDVSLITVEHAYELLCDEGYLEGKQRSGYYVCFRDSECFSVSERDEVRAEFSVGKNLVPNDFPYTVIAKIMRKVLSDMGDELFVRSENNGSLRLRAAISRYLARSRGIAASPQQIVVGAGAEYLYGLIVQMLGRDIVYGMENPSYEKIEQVYRAYGATCEMLPLCADGIESGALAASKANVLHITPYRSYPSGVTASASKRHEYLHWVRQGKRFIVEDDFESEFTASHKPEETLFSLAEGERIIYMNTFSRTVSPSLRVGYMVLPRSLIDLYERTVGFYSCTVPTFEQSVIAQLLESGEFERHLNRVRRRLRRESDS